MRLLLGDYTLANISFNHEVTRSQPLCRAVHWYLLLTTLVWHNMQVNTGLIVACNGIHHILASMTNHTTAEVLKHICKLIAFTFFARFNNLRLLDCASGSAGQCHVRPV